MSYFKCSHGEVYFPFGKLSRKKLRKEMMLASDPNYVESINVHSFPLSSQLSDLSGSFKEEETTEQSLATFDEEENEDAPGIPFVERHPNSEVAGRYSHLCDDVLSEIFKIQLNSQLVSSQIKSTFHEFIAPCPASSIGFSRKEEVSHSQVFHTLILPFISLRYYTSTQALEYHIPSVVLRYHDPLTGVTHFSLCRPSLSFHQGRN